MVALAMLGVQFKRTVVCKRNREASSESDGSVVVMGLISENPNIMEVSIRDDDRAPRGQSVRLMDMTLSSAD